MKIVRFGNGNGGPCDLLGPLIRETKTSFVYRCRGGMDASISRRLAHIEPCPCCPDHGHSRFEQLAEPD
jgi:hypothetical protein